MFGVRIFNGTSKPREFVVFIKNLIKSFWRRNLAESRKECRAREKFRISIQTPPEKFADFVEWRCSSAMRIKLAFRMEIEKATLNDLAA